MNRSSAYNGRNAKARRRRRRGRKHRSGGLGLKLAICAAVFGAASVFRLLFPATAAQLGERLNRVCDLRSAFTVLGEGISGRRDMKEALDDAYRYAFSPSLPENEPPEEMEQASAPEEERAAPAFAAGKASLSETPASPVSGRVVRSFGFQDGEGDNSFSYGTEVDAAFGTPVYAMLSGDVAAVGESRTKGSFVVIFSEGAETEYSGLGTVSAEVGAEVLAGQPIASAGEGPVRVELITDSGYCDAEDYVTWS